MDNVYHDLVYKKIWRCSILENINNEVNYKENIMQAQKSLHGTITKGIFTIQRYMAKKGGFGYARRDGMIS